MPLTADKIYKVNISSDNLTATMSINTKPPPGNPIPDEIVTQIKALGLVIDAEGVKAIEDFAAALADKKVPKPVVVARGKPPQHDQPGRVEKLYAKQTTQAQDEQDNETNSQSHYDRTNIITVEKDQEILRLIPPVSGQDGVDVYGKAIARKLGREAEIKLGANLQRNENVVVATASGKLNCSGGKYWVSTDLEINGDVDFSVGNIDFPGDVTIAKNIIDLFKVRSAANITVRGLAEAAEVHADMDLYITGGITGKEKGHFSAGQDIKSKYITNATVRAGRDIEVSTEILHSDVVCLGRLIVENGAFVGGRAVATGGAKVKHLGSEANAKTLVEVGIDEDLRKKYTEVASEVSARRQKAQKVRQIVEPLLQNQKHLNAEQKEKATELLYQATELEDESKEMIEDLRQAAEKAQQRATAEIEVIGTVYTGVTVRFPRVETTIATPIKGPLKIMPRRVDHSLRVVAVDTNSGSVHDLGSNPEHDDIWNAIEELLRSDSQ